MTEASSEGATARPGFGRVAVCLYGYPRTFAVTAPSLLKHLAEPLDADLFFFGPAASDRPRVDHCGVSGFSNAVRGGGKAKDGVDLTAADPAALKEAYGARLKGSRFHGDGPLEIDGLSRDEWIFGVDPTRFFAMARNMAGAFREMRSFEQTSGRRYDHVILTRCDLAFYQTPGPAPRPGVLHVARGSGFDNAGQPKTTGAKVLPYRNILTGEACPANAEFVDQILVFTRDDAELIEHLDQALLAAARARVPLQAETLLYYHFAVKNHLEVRAQPWAFEIVRADQPLVVNATDLDGIPEYDPTNPKARRKISGRRLAHAVANFTRVFMRRVVHPLRYFYALEKRF